MFARSSLPLALVLVCACADPSRASEDADGEAGSNSDATGSVSPDLGAETDPGTDTLATDSSESGSSECPPPPCEACSCVDGELVCDCLALDPEAGFVELDAVDYELGIGPAAIELSATASRQFWSLQPAEFDPAEAPVFVLFNGGPGVSSGMLLGLNTGPRSFDPSLTGPEQRLAANPSSWTSLGTMIWIDARQTGFSYGLLADPSDLAARQAAMSVANFNSYRDAAEFVRTLLTILAEHPELRDNPVILVAESYGGIRAQIILDMLLEPNAYADGSRRLRDPELLALIASHHAAVHGPDPTPEQIAEQFGRQILIQPALTGITQQLTAGVMFEQPGSKLDVFAAEFGEPYPTCAELGAGCNPYTHALEYVSGHGRSGYDSRAPLTWLDDLFALVNVRLNDSGTTALLLGVDPLSIEGLAARGRIGGWRAINLAPYPADAAIGDWPELAGELQAWDRYFMPFNAEALDRFRGYTARLLEVDPADPHFGELFLRNLIWVDTLITDASYDLVVPTAALPEALRSYPTWVSDVIVDPDASEWLIEYTPELGAIARVVTVPSYAAGHAVSLDAPAQLHDDVAAWLGD